MRRLDREITDFNEIIKIIDESDVVRVALNNGDYPYILPLNFGYEVIDGQLTLFFHGSPEGSKHEIIAKDPHVTFEVDSEHEVMEPIGEDSCTASYCYASVIGHGIIEKTADDEKEHLLIKLLEHYGIKGEHVSPERLARTSVYKIKVVDMTGKRHINNRVKK